MSETNYTRAIVNTVETFLDTCPDIPEWVEIKYGPQRVLHAEMFRPEGIVQTVTIGGRAYSVEVRPALSNE